MEDPTTTHYKISSTGRQVLMFFYLLVFDRIHDTMYLDKKIQDLQQRNPTAYLTIGMGYFLSLLTPNRPGGFAAKKLFF